ncbi:unknown [Clostridium sp. CAG:448]|nr:unknown [Clostridium sp. CAG:448]
MPRLDRNLGQTSFAARILYGNSVILSVRFRANRTDIAPQIKEQDRRQLCLGIFHRHLSRIPLCDRSDIHRSKRIGNTHGVLFPVNHKAVDCRMLACLLQRIRIRQNTVPEGRFPKAQYASHHRVYRPLGFFLAPHTKGEHLTDPCIHLQRIPACARIEHR